MTDSLEYFKDDPQYGAPGAAAPANPPATLESVELVGQPVVAVEDAPSIPMAVVRALKTLLQAMGAGGGVFIGWQEFKLAAGAAALSLLWNILTALEIRPPRWLKRRYNADRTQAP